MRKRIGIAVALIIVISVAYLLTRPRSAVGDWVEGSGVIEATEVDVSALVGGKLTRLLVREGDAVTSGQVVAEVDAEELQSQVAQAQGALDSARADLARAEALLAGASLASANAHKAYESSTELKGRYESAQAHYQAALAARDQARARLDLVRAGTRKEQLAQTRAAVAGAEAAWDEAQRELARLEKLLASGAIPQQQVDRQRTAMESATATLDGARARLAEAEAGARTEEERQAEAALAQAEANVEVAAHGLATAQELLKDRLELKQQVDAADAQRRAAADAKGAAEGRLASAQAAVAQTEKRMRDATIHAPIDGVVLLKIREAGENVAPGQPILRLADLDRMWVRVYVPVADLGRVKLGQQAEVTADASPGRVYGGEVTEIAQEAEFTPKNVQTRQQRVKLVFGVKIEVENPERELKPGLPADARIKTEAKARDA